MKKTIDNIRIEIDAENAKDRIKELADAVRKLNQDLDANREKMNTLGKKTDRTPEDNNELADLATQRSELENSLKSKLQEYKKAVERVKGLEAGSNYTSISDLQKNLKNAKNIQKEILPTDTKNLDKFHRIIVEITAQIKLLEAGLTTVEESIDNIDNLGSSQLKSLKTVIESLRGTYAPSEEPYKNLSEQLSLVQKKIKETNTDFVALNNTLANLPNASVAELQDALNILNKQYDATKPGQNKDKLGAQIKEVQEQLRIATTDSAQLEHVLNNLSSASIEEMKSALKTLNEQLNNSKSGLEMQTLQERIEIISKEIETATLNQEKYNRILSDLPNASVAELQDALSMLTKQYNATKPGQNKDELASKIKDVQEQLRLANTDSVQLENTLKNLNGASIEEMNNALKTLNEQFNNSHSSKEMQELQQKIELVNKAIESATLNQEKYNRILSDLPNASIAELQDALSMLNKQYNAAKPGQGKDELSAKIKEVQEQLRLATADSAQLDKVLNNLNDASIEEMKEALKALNDQFNNSHSSDEMERLRSVIDSVQKKIDEATIGAGRFNDIIRNSDIASINELQEALAMLNKQYNAEVPGQSRDRIGTQIKEIQEQLRLATMDSAQLNETLGHLDTASIDDMEKALKTLNEQFKNSHDEQEMNILRVYIEQVKKEIELASIGAERFNKILEAPSLASISELQQVLAVITKKYNSFGPGEGKNKLAVQITEIQEALRAATRDFASLNKTMQNLDHASINELESALKTLNGQLKDARGESAMVRIRENIMLVSNALEKATSDQKDYNNLFENLSTASIKDLEDALSDLNKQIKNTEPGKGLDELREKARLVEDQLRTTTTDTAQLEQTLDNLDGASIKELEDALKALQNKLKDAKDPKAITALQQSIQNVDQQIKRTTVDAGNINYVLSNIRTAPIDKLKKAAEDLKVKITTLERNTVSYREAIESLRKVERQLQNSGENWSRKSTFIENATKRLKSYVGVYLSFQQATSIVRDTSKDLMELSDSIADIQKVTKMSEKQVDGLSKALDHIDTRSSQEQLHKLGYQAGLLGLSSQDDIIGFVKAADQMNWALKELGDDGAVQLMKVANLMGEVQKTGGVEEALTRVGSAINELTANSAASAGPIVNFVSRMGSVGAICHYTSADLVAIGSTLDALAVPAERGGTAMNKFMSALDTNLPSIAEKLNFSADAVKKMQESGNAMEGMLFVLGKLKEQGDGGMSALEPIFKDLGGEGERLKSVIASLVQHVDMLRDYSDISNSAYDEGVSMLNEFNIKNETAAATFERLGNIIKEKFINSEFVRWLQTVGKYLVDIMTHQERHIYELTIIKNLLQAIGILIITYIAKKGVDAFKNLRISVLQMRNPFTLLKNDFTAIITKYKELGSTATGVGGKIVAFGKTAGFALQTIGGYVTATVSIFYILKTVIEFVSEALSKTDPTKMFKTEAIKEANEEMGAQSVEAATLFGRLQDLNTELPVLQKNTKKYKEGTKEAKDASEKYNAALMEKHRLIRQANSNYSSYLGYQITETDNNKQLASSMRAVNRALQEKMALMVKEKMIEKASDAIAEPVNDATDNLLSNVEELANGIGPVKGERHDKIVNFITTRMTPVINNIIAKIVAGQFTPEKLATKYRQTFEESLKELKDKGTVTKKEYETYTGNLKRVAKSRKTSSWFTGDSLAYEVKELREAVNTLRQTTKLANEIAEEATKDNATSERIDVLGQMSDIVKSLNNLVSKTKTEKNQAQKEQYLQQYQSGLGRLKEIYEDSGAYLGLSDNDRKIWENRLDYFTNLKIMKPDENKPEGNLNKYNFNDISKNPVGDNVEMLKNLTKAMLSFQKGNVQSIANANKLIPGAKFNENTSVDEAMEAYKGRIKQLYGYLGVRELTHEGKVKDQDNATKEAKKAAREQFKVLEAIIEEYFTNLSKETNEAFLNNKITDEQRESRLSAITQNKSLTKANLYSVILGEEPSHKNTVDLSAIFKDTNLNSLAELISKYVKSDEEFTKMRTQADNDALTVEVQNMNNLNKLLNRRNYEEQASDKTAETVVKWGLLSDADKKDLDGFMNLLTMMAKLPKNITKEDLEKIFPKDDIFMNTDYLKGLMSPKTQEIISNPDFSTMSDEDRKTWDTWNDSRLANDYHIGYGDLDNYDQQIDILLTILENYRNDLVEAKKKTNEKHTKIVDENWKPNEDEFNQQMQESDTKRGVLSSFKDLGITPEESMQDYDIDILKQKIQYQMEYIQALKDGGADAFDAQQKLYEMQTELDQKDMERTKGKLEHVKEYADAIVSFSESMGEAAFGEVSDRKEAAKQLIKSVMDTSKQLIMIWVQEQVTKKLLNKQSTADKAQQVSTELNMEATQTQANVQLGMASGAAHEIGSKGVLGMALISVISAALSALLSAAMSAVTSAMSKVSSSGGSTMSKVASGMLTYAEGNYPVLGSDGVVYNARRVDNWKTGVYQGPHYGIIAEKKPELIVDGNTTQKMMTMRPDLYAQILSLATNTRPQRMKTYADGNLPVVMTQQNNSVDQTTIMALQQTMVATATVIDNLSQQLQKGISISPYGENGAVRQLQKSSAWMAKHGLI